MSDQLGSPEGEAIADDLLILFQRNPRPTFEQVRDACDGADIIDAAPKPLADPSRGVVEPRRSGLAFDLVGLGPGPAAPIPDLGGAEIEGAIGQDGTCALSLRVGPHIAAGRHTLAILRAWFTLAQGVGQRHLDDSGRRMLGSTGQQTLKGGGDRHQTHARRPHCSALPRCCTKLQGRVRLSSCGSRIRVQAVRQALVEPGMQATSVRLARPASARD